MSKIIHTSICKNCGHKQKGLLFRCPKCNAEIIETTTDII